VPLVVGIDEAGYGPLLGPLVVAGTWWRMTPEAVGTDLWVRLGASVCRGGSRGTERLSIDDSKKVYDRKRGMWTLERGVLAFARAAGVPCDTLAALLGAIGFDARPAAAMPWYRDMTRTLPTDPARAAFAGAAARLQRTMASGGVACCGLRAQVLTEDAYNRRVAQTHNKAAVVVEAVLRLVHEAGRQCGDQELHVFVDRLGGRTDYGRLLMQAFPERHLHVLELNEARSRYRLADAAGDWYVSFEVDGDQAHLPIALASMVAKYVRELLMERFNAYWRGLAPDLTPTAGYYRDAQRFLRDIQPILARSGLATERFVRAR
jgi:ribonuclease HII